MPTRRSLILLVVTALTLCFQSSGTAQRNRALERIVIDPVVTRPTSTDAAAQKIISNHLKYRGGSNDLNEAVSRLRGVQSLHSTGTLVEGSAEFMFELWQRAPDLCRFETTRTHLGWTYHHVVATDGTTQWTQELRPKQGRREPVSGSAARPLREYARLHGPFLDHEKHDIHFTYGGVISLAERRAYVLHGYFPDETIRQYYFDVSNYMLIAEGLEEEILGERVAVQRFYTRYEIQDGMYFPTAWVYWNKGTRYRSVSVSSIEINPALDDALFAYLPKDQIIVSPETNSAPWSN